MLHSNEPEKNANQATRLYLRPPVYGKYDERRETGQYGVTDLANTITKRGCFNAIMHYLLPSEAACMKQTRKLFGDAVETASEQIVRHLHALHYSRVPLPLPVAAVGGGGGGGGGSTWTRYLHELTTNKSHKLLLMGGGDGYESDTTNRVDMMVIDDEGTKISWQACAPMIKKRFCHAAYYCQGQVLSVNSDDGDNADGDNPDGQGTCERYDVLSQTAVELEHTLPIPDLRGVSMAELDGKVFVIGGKYKDATTDRYVASDRVFCLDMNRGQAGKWIEQEARLITRRFGAAAATYQGKVWLAGGCNQNLGHLSSIEVFDPLVGSWQPAGYLTRGQVGSIALFVIENDLFAAGCNYSIGMWVAKRDGQTGAWQLVSELNDGERNSCGLAACGSTIYFLGGYNSRSNKNWNSFDTRTNKWASQQEQYRDVATRQLPRTFNGGQAVCITPSEQLLGLSTWTSYPDFVHCQEEEEVEEEEDK